MAQDMKGCRLPGQREGAAEGHSNNKDFTKPLIPITEYFLQSRGKSYISYFKPKFIEFHLPLSIFIWIVMIFFWFLAAN